MAVIKEYALKTLHNCYGEDTRMCDIRMHFRDTRPEMLEHITDKMFSNTLMNVVDLHTDWEDIVELDKHYTDKPTKCEIYRNLAFIDPDVKEAYAAFRPLPRKRVVAKSYAVLNAPLNGAAAKRRHSDL
jgi:hypothetical protein